MTLEEELKLVEQAKTNIQAFAHIYDFYYKKIYFYCRNRLGSKELAEDVTSFVFMKAVQEIAKFNTKKKIRFSSWLYRTAQNKIIDIYRENGRKKMIELIEDNEPSVDNINEHVNKHQRQTEISLTLLELKDRYQEIISLKFLSGLELEEISEVMKISKSNAAVLLSRALESFRKAFKEKFPESEIFSY
jgi:RNA polymerase sigma-70 factor (ECF subfamily)